MPNATGTPATTTDTGGMDIGSMMGGTATPEGSGMNMGHEMNPSDPTDTSPASMDARGGQPLDSTVVNGVREFKLTAGKTLWDILLGVDVVAYTYNGTVPGPEIPATEGARIRIIVTNHLPEPTSIHWHGVHVPNDQDGAADVTQPPIQSGETYTYEGTVPNTPGTFFYHTHANADTQQTLGLYAPPIIEPKNPTTNYDLEYTLMPGAWTVKDGKTYPAIDTEGLPNYFAFNVHSSGNRCDQREKRAKSATPRN